jgi:hypothetical protein
MPIVAEEAKQTRPRARKNAVWLLALPLLLALVLVIAASVRPLQFGVEAGHMPVEEASHCEPVRAWQSHPVRILLKAEAPS